MSANTPVDLPHFSRAPAAFSHGVNSDAGRLRTNQLARTVSGGARSQWVYTYGNGGDLSGIAYNDGGLTPGVTFTYDRLGRRLTAVRGSTTTTFFNP